MLTHFVLQVSMHDPDEAEMFKLKVNLETGDAQLHVLPPTVGHDPLMFRNVTEDMVSRKSGVTSRRIAPPSEGFRWEH